MGVLQDNDHNLLWCFCLDDWHTLWHKVNEMRMDKVKWEKAKAKYFAGETWETIANDLQLNKATLTNKASLEGITKVKREALAISPKKEISLESLSVLVRSKLAEDAASTLERIEGYDLEGLKDEATRETILASVAKRSALTFGWSEQGEQASVSINLLGSMPDKFHVEQVVSEPPEK